MSKYFTLLTALLLVANILYGQSNCNNATTINASDQILIGGIPEKYLFTPEEDGVITLQTCGLASSQTWLAQVRVFVGCGTTEIQPTVESDCGNEQRSNSYAVRANQRVRIALQIGIFGGDRLLFSFNPTSSCESPYFSGNIKSLQCEKFENYELSTISDQSSNWVIWEDGVKDHLVSNERSSCLIQNSVRPSIGQSLKVEGAAVETDLADAVYLLGERTIDGVYQLNWNMYVPTGKEAYFNIQTSEGPVFEGGGAFQLLFTQGGDISSWRDTEVLSSYPQDQWFPVVLTFERLIDSIQLTVVIDGIPLLRTIYGDLNTPLGGINFYATGQNAAFFVDCICLNQLECNIFVLCTDCASTCINGIDFTCLPCNSYGIDYSKVETKKCPTYESENAIEITCGEIITNQLLDGEDRMQEYSCPNFPSAFSNLRAKEKIYTFELTTPSDVTIEILPESRDPESEVTAFIFSECIASCNVEQTLVSKVDDFFDYQGSAVMASSLPAGQYFVVVDAARTDLLTSEEDSYSIVFKADCGERPRVCDLGGRFINYGNNIQGSFEKTDNKLLNLREAACLMEELGGGIPSDYYFDTFIFYNDGDEGNTRIGVSDLNNPNGSDRQLITYAFECDCREATFNLNELTSTTCFQTCLEDGNGPKNATIDEPKEGTFYYFVVGGPLGMEYDFDFVPGGACSGALKEKLNSDTLLVDQVIEAGTGNYDNIIENRQPNLYANCTNSNNSYRGKEKVYELNIDRNVNIDIQLDAKAAMGMFLFNNDCGRDCRARAELPANSQGRIISIQDTLVPGTYFLIIDTENTEGGAFDLTIQSTIQPALFLSTQGENAEDCPKNEEVIHEVTIRQLNNTEIADNAYVIFHVGLPDGSELPVTSDPPQWEADKGKLIIDLYQDDLTLGGEKCSYEEGDPFIIKIKPEDNGSQSNAQVVEAVWIEDLDGEEFTATDTFKSADGYSGILDFKVIKSESLIVSTSGDCENFDSGGFQVAVSTSADLEWFVVTPPGENWFSVSPSSGKNSEILSVTFNSPNTSSTKRSATFSVESTTGQKKQVTVCQDFSCSNILVDAGRDVVFDCETGLTFLSAAYTETSGTEEHTQFNWVALSGSILTDPNDRNIFVDKPGLYELTFSSFSGCKKIDTVQVFEEFPVIMNESIQPNSGKDIPDGSIAVTVSGGTPPYTYLWNDMDGSSTLNNISDGTYDLVVTDQNGCQASKTFQLESVEQEGNNGTGMEEENNNTETGEEETSPEENTSNCAVELANNLTVSNIQTDFAYIYTSQPYDFVKNQFRYRSENSSDWIETDISNLHYRPLSNLTLSTTYEFQVRHQCEANAWSAYSDSATFTTLGGAFNNTPLYNSRIHTETSLLLFPNPATNSFYVFSKTPFLEQQQLLIVNIWGQYQNVIPLQTGEKQQLVDISDLSSGLYFIHYETEDTIHTIKFVKE